eukprot:GHVU01235084.1.p2 GENE.GHVU01235084.1~~GHVU01235084.1.p2  ORF type:complete len:260 (-),score=26.21 GHVU01235084.1:97-876(-)
MDGPLRHSTRTGTPTPATAKRRGGSLRPCPMGGRPKMWFLCSSKKESFNLLPLDLLEATRAAHSGHLYLRDMQEGDFYWRNCRGGKQTLPATELHPSYECRYTTVLRTEFTGGYAPQEEEWCIIPAQGEGGQLVKAYSRFPYPLQREGHRALPAVPSVFRSRVTAAWEDVGSVGTLSATRDLTNNGNFERLRMIREVVDADLEEIPTANAPLSEGRELTRWRASVLAGPFRAQRRNARALLAMGPQGGHGAPHLSVESR